MTATPLLAALLIGSLADDASAKVKISWPGAIENATAATKVIVAPVSRELSSYVTVANTLPALTPVVDPIVAPIPTFAVEKDGGSAGTASGYNFVSFDLYRCPKSFDARGSIDSDEALSTCAGRVDNISMHLIDGAGDQVATAESKRCDRSTAMPGFSTRRPPNTTSASRCSSSSSRAIRPPANRPLRLPPATTSPRWFPRGSTIRRFSAPPSPGPRGRGRGHAGDFAV